MRADNRGEGGILALMSLTRAKWRGRNRYLIIFGLIGAALLYGDGMITPAISVLSAVEGLKVASGDFAPYTMPIAAVILLLLFLVQRFGTAAVGNAFGPVMLLWFVFIAVLGAIGIRSAPHVLFAADPRYAASYLYAQRSFEPRHPRRGVSLRDRRRGDVRRYGTSRPQAHSHRLDVHRFAGIAAELCRANGRRTFKPRRHDNPFFQLVPAWALYPAVVLSTLATVIASQAIITGSFSLTRQAMQLGWLPGMHISQTSSEESGQIYVPFVNWLMMLGTLALTVVFAHSDRLAGAYGAAVSTTMLMTTAILYRIMRVLWRWPNWAAVGLFSFFMIVDCAFFGGQSHEDRRWRLDSAGVRRVDFHRHDDVARRPRRHAPPAGARRRDRRAIRPAIARAQDCTRSRPRDLSHAVARLHSATDRRSCPPDGGRCYEEAVALTVHICRIGRACGPAAGFTSSGWAKAFGMSRSASASWKSRTCTAALQQEKSKCPDRSDDAIYFSERDRVVSGSKNRGCRRGGAGFFRSCTAIQFIRRIASIFRPRTSCRSAGKSRFRRAFEPPACLAVCGVTMLSRAPDQDRLMRLR